MEMLMQLWKPEFKLDGINSGSWYHCYLLIGKDTSSMVRGRLYSIWLSKV